MVAEGVAAPPTATRRGCKVIHGPYLPPAGEVRRDIHSQRGLSNALGIPVIEMLIASGHLRGEDLAEAIRAWQTTGADVDYSQYTAGPPEPDLRALASAYEIPTERRADFMDLIEAVAALTQNNAAPDDALPSIKLLVSTLNSTTRAYAPPGDVAIGKPGSGPRAEETEKPKRVVRRRLSRPPE